MSYNIFFAADYHFGHESPYNKFTKADGSFLRSEFKNAQEGDLAMVERHNSVVKPNDRVYVVGDVAFHKRNLHYLNMMNGRKVLIKGNHDLETLKVYSEYFDDIRGSHQFAGMLITHIPVHPQSLARWGVNVHGHLHANKVMMEVHHICADDPPGYVEQVPDPRYICVSVEQINYTPISLEDVRKRIPV